MKITWRVILFISILILPLNLISLSVSRNALDAAIEQILMVQQGMADVHVELWGILVGCAGLLAVDLYILIALDLKMRFALIVVLLVMAAVYVAAAGYIFPIQGCFDNSVVNILKNSVILAVLHFPKTILITATNMAPFWLFAVAPDAVWMTLPFWFAIGGASVAYLNSILLQSVFARYTDESAWQTE